MIYLDFETRSEAELKAVGTYRYARDGSTDILCMCWTWDDELDVGLWHPGFRDFAFSQEQKVADRTQEDIPATPFPEELAERILLGEEIEAHNAFFERNIWDAIMVPRYGFPVVEFEQWRCSAAMAASFAMRRKLEHVATDLNLAEQKDMVGHRLMMKLTKPRSTVARERVLIAEANDMGEWHTGKTGKAKPRYIIAPKADAQLKGRTCDLRDRGIAIPDEISSWNQSRAELLKVFDYCKQDVRTERAISNALRPLSGTELDIWQLDQKINLRGLHLDRPMVEGALKVGAAAEADAQVQLEGITKGAVDKTTKRAKFKEWLRDEGVEIPTKIVKEIDGEGNETQVVKETTGADYIRPLLTEVPPHVARAIEIWLAVNKTSTKKYKAMIERLMDDDRVRETLRYWGASTGRWGGLGIQPHNFPRNCPKPALMETLCADIARGDYDDVCMLHGRDDIMVLLSRILRGAVTAAPGHDLIAADYSQIEARGTFWIAGHEEGLKEIRRLDALGKDATEDLYTSQASMILGHKVTKADEYERQVWGKVPSLACGYQGGVGALQVYAEVYGAEIDDVLAKQIVDGYREANWPVKEFWYEAERCAIEAVFRGPSKPAVVMDNGNIRFKRLGAFLHCRLPNGRLLSYFCPRVEMDERFGKPKVTFTGYATYKPGMWCRCSTYGGKLTENIVQALCRDIMAEAMLRVEAGGYPVVLTVHDEIISEIRKDEGDVAEFEGLLTEVPAWATGFPVVADGWRRERYGK